MMNETDREHLATNIVAAGAGITEDVRRRVIEYWTNVDSNLGNRVAEGLGSDAKQDQAA